MKEKYVNPQISVEVLEKADVLTGSIETENSYASSSTVFKTFSFSDII